MRKVFFVLAGLLPVLIFAQPCTTSNGAGCTCADGTDTCFLLPDLTISWYGLLNHSGGPDEFSQTGNGADNGRLRISGSTPNIGRGAFTVRGTDYYVCGTDTIYSTNTNFTCPDGSTPRNLLHQRIYIKQNGGISYEDVFAGAQTYHPSHGHNHVDDWVTFTLRIENPSEPDTLKWQIIGNGAKIGFCLMDYGSCNTYNGHCRDRQTYGGGTILTSTDFPNFGMGGGNYSCSPVEQGISVGYTDIYNESLDGMWINIPPNSCNGNYWIVAEVDPTNNFRESNETNNWTAIPFTLTKQTPLGSAVAEIEVNGSPYLCNSVPVQLEAGAASSYLWSTGDSTQAIAVTAPGDYFVGITSQCGSAVSDTITITSVPAAITYTEQDSVCISGAVELNAQGPGEVKWYDAPIGGNLLDTGFLFTTPLLQSTTLYYAENVSSVNGLTTFAQPRYHTGTGLYSTFNGSVIFDCFSDFVLKSVKVYTNTPGNRTIELKNSSNAVLQSVSVYISQDTQRVTLDFPVTPGSGYQLGTNEGVNNTNFGNSSPQLRRSGSGVNYPYVMNGVLSLNDSPYGQTYYYYFYDWEIQTGGFTCIGPREPVAAVVLSPPALSVSGLDSVYQITDTADTLTGNPAGGVFSGDGINGNIFDPALAGLGTHSISYFYEDENGCSNIDTLAVTVRMDSLAVGIAELLHRNELNIFPNPTNSEINIEFIFLPKSDLKIRVHNSIGQLVLEEAHVKPSRLLSFDFSGYSNGIYFVEIIEPGESFITKFFKN